MIRCLHPCRRAMARLLRRVRAEGARGRRAYLAARELALDAPEGTWERDVAARSLWPLSGDPRVWSPTTRLGWRLPAGDLVWCCQLHREQAMEGVREARRERERRYPGLVCSAAGLWRFDPAEWVRRHGGDTDDPH